jgi:hypothetical protein
VSEIVSNNQQPSGEHHRPPVLHAAALRPPAAPRWLPLNPQLRKLDERTSLRPPPAKLTVKWPASLSLRDWDTRQRSGTPRRSQAA